MDGSGDETVTLMYSTRLNYTFVFTLDHSQQVLYWMNGSSSCYYTNYIESSNVNGLERKIVHSTSRLGSCSASYYLYSQGIDFFGGAVYSYSGYHNDIVKTVVDGTPTVFRYEYINYYMCYSIYTGMKVISCQRQLQGAYMYS